MKDSEQNRALFFSIRLINFWFQIHVVPACNTQQHQTKSLKIAVYRESVNNRTTTTSPFYTIIFPFYLSVCIVQPYIYKTMIKRKVSLYSQVEAVGHFWQ